jgi:fatty-acyl-CoA synthase
VELLFGISLTGAVMVPINARFAPRELGYVIENGDLEVLFTSDLVVEHVDYVARLQEALPGLADRPAGAAPELAAAPQLRTIVLLGGRKAPGMMTGEAFANLAGPVDDAAVLTLHRRTAVRDVALMMYTSGTTAMPKGCLLSHEALVRPALVGGRTRFRLGPDDRFWDPLPMFHMSAILPLIGTLDGGAAFLSMEHFDADRALGMIVDERATVIYPTFPAVTQALLNNPSYHPDLFRDVRVALNVAPPDSLRAMQAQMPHTVQIASYGLTECGGVTCFNDVEDTLDQRVTTCGTPFEGMEVEIRDLETGARLPAGERGEIVIRGYGVFSGYHKDPARTNAVLDADGWFHTGDVGALDDGGRVAYLGRTKDMLKVGGENVAAVEIESHIGTHPAVSIVAVVGVPDAKYLEVPAAFIELRPGSSASEEEILEHCRGGLARFKVPRHVRFVTSWPLSATKIQKYRLQETLAQELAEGAAAIPPS